ncbi:hypothetical protein AZI86_15205 [Bdellovibrio bacteriovorus]|uniref:Uncharacterized protein n=1 Tax=Bdellovibrio bacteriovorus TaxID=959 RepID=A0A150WHZ3_BDEBC|nr:hypothetical protein [Bdellovibrio bacteriovorus]KYG63065.1 hypothetical protein AZI86_15205 [Bdellovibrio bacteriovorus]
MGRMMSETYVNRTNSDTFTSAKILRVASPFSSQFGFTILTLIAYFAVWRFASADSWISQAFFAEDHLGEWLQFAFCLATGVVALKTFRRASPKWLSAAILLGGVGMIFIGGEEISWGQRLFNFPSSEFFFLRNYQNETNLHNLLPLESNLIPYYIAAFVLGVVLNAIGFKLTPSGQKWPVADMFISSLIMAAFYFFLPMSQHIYFYEYTELWIYASIFIYTVRIRKNLLVENNRGVL